MSNADTIRSALKSGSGPMITTELVELTDLTSKEVLSALNNLVLSGQVEREDRNGEKPTYLLNLKFKPKRASREDVPSPAAAKVKKAPAAAKNRSPKRTSAQAPVKRAYTRKTTADASASPASAEAGVPTCRALVPAVSCTVRFSPKGGTFNTYLGDLRRAAFIEERRGLVYATEAGVTSLGDKLPAKPTSHDEAMAQWRQALRAGAFKMLEAVVAAGPRGLVRQEIADEVSMESKGGTFNTYLGDLRRNGLLAESGGRCVANDILFPGGT